MENLTAKLKKLKEIQPDAEYSQRSKLIIFATPVLAPKHTHTIFNWQMALTTVGLLLVLISGGVFRYVSRTTPNLNTQAIKTELQGLDINIQLAKIEYYQKVDETVSLALKGISENNKDNAGILNTAPSAPEQNQPTKEKPANNENIKDLLDQLLL